jgi:hypothetical protein
VLSLQLGGYSGTIIADAGHQRCVRGPDAFHGFVAGFNIDFIGPC